MIHENTLQGHEKERGFFLEDEVSIENWGQQKFIVSNFPLPSCRKTTDTSWADIQLVFKEVFSGSSGDLTSEDVMFHRAAEKVDHKIVMDRRIYGGAPCVANTRVPVYAILEMVEAGYSHKRILKAFPSIDKEGLEAALRFAIIVMER